jgi:hypothetical protein
LDGYNQKITPPIDVIEATGAIHSTILPGGKAPTLEDLQAAATAPALSPDPARFGSAIAAGTWQTVDGSGVPSQVAGALVVGVEAEVFEIGVPPALSSGCGAAYIYYQISGALL